MVCVLTNLVPRFYVYFLEVEKGPPGDLYRYVASLSGHFVLFGMSQATFYGEDKSRNRPNVMILKVYYLSAGQTSLVQVQLSWILSGPQRFPAV